MKLNIDEANDHFGKLVDDAIAEIERPDGAEFVENDEWENDYLQAPTLFEFACELSLKRCPRGAMYDTDEDGVILDALRALLSMRMSKIAPNGMLYPRKGDK